MMIPLKTNRLILTWLCVYQNDDMQSGKREQLMHCAFALSILCMHIIGFVASAAYFVKFFTIDFEESLFALLQMCGTANMIYITMITFMLRHQITDIFITISAIYAECEYHISLQEFRKLCFSFHFIFVILDAKTTEFRYLMRAHNKSEWMWHAFFHYLMIPNGCLIILMAVIAIFTYWLFDDDIASIYHTFKTVSVTNFFPKKKIKQISFDLQVF